MFRNELKKQLINQQFIETIKVKGACQTQIDLCKRFIRSCWSNDDRLSGRMQEITADIAKHTVERLFGEYISREAFILAAAEFGFEVSPLNKSNALIKYRIYYDQNY